ncbi:unnamed protein product [Trichobilharzia szidati]|nr:unnamed protein product [Trichobilharzia szidati]
MFPNEGTNKSTQWIACDKVVVRDQNRRPLLLTSSKPIAFHSKPIVSVIPTQPVQLTQSHKLSHNPVEKVDKEVQTDNDYSIDTSIMSHIEDMIRTQRGLSSINRNTSRLSFNEDNNNDKDSLKKALELQQKINADLKHLLVSALSGNLNVAQQLMDLIKSNANLYGQSEGLSHQKAVLEELADTAEIAADVWQTKCLASRLVASEAVKQANLSIHQAHLARQALAHLLGERAQIRRYLSQTIPLLTHFCQKNNMKLYKSTDQTCDTLNLTSLCFDLASIISPNINVKPIYCNSDTLGEELAQYVLTRNDSGTKKYNRMPFMPSNVSDTSTAVLSTIPPLELTDTDDLLQKALNTFQSTKRDAVNDVQLFACRKCVGNVLVV